MLQVKVLGYVGLAFLLACMSLEVPDDMRIDEERERLLARIEMGPGLNGKYGYGPLLLPRFTSFDDLQSVIDIEYIKGKPAKAFFGKKSFVRLTHRCRGGTVTSVLKAGVSQADFMQARIGTLRDKIKLGLRCPFAVIHKGDLTRIEHLARRRPLAFGRGDVAFYHLAEAMVYHIVEEDRLKMSKEDLSEKGYLNTFNHITAQAFMTSIFSESLADFVADMHELYNLPTLATGEFSMEQKVDLLEGPVDNYIDMINNEWGQELGKKLGQTHHIKRQTHWTPVLLSEYLNDIQQYLSWSLQIAFQPFTPADEIVIRFAAKINHLLSGPQ